jgi:hypothetical protein
MKHTIVTLFIVFVSSLAYSQNTGYSRTELPLYKVDNKNFTIILDSIVSYSERCEGKGLDLLNFSLIIREVNPNYYHIQITLINCQDLNFLLTSNHSSNETIGYFIHKNKNFIISCRCDLMELFNPTNKKKIFTTFGSKYLWNIDYTDWNYSYYAPDNKFEMTSFNPINVPEKNKIFPICNDSLDVKQK